MIEEKSSDPLQAVKEVEARILKVQGDIQHLKERIQLSESEERADIEASKKKIEDNDELIRKLRRQVQDLQITRTQGLHGDEKIIAKAFSEYSAEIGILAGKTGPEAVQILDGKVYDLIKKSNALVDEVETKKKELEEYKKLERDIAWDTYNEFELKHAESETQRRVREMENDYRKVENSLIECHVIQSKYKAIQELLRMEILVYPNLLEEAEEKCRQQKDDINKLIASEEKAHKRREMARKKLTKAEAQALQSRQEKEQIVSKYNEALKPKQDTTEMQSTELRDLEAAEEWRKIRDSQETELENLHKEFDKIKEVLGISDINEAETLIKSQKATKEELSQLLANTEQKLIDLKEEAAELQLKNESLRGAELSTPQVVLENQLRDAEFKQEEQKKRKDMAEAELERVTTLYADIKAGLWQQLQLMERYLKESAEEEEAMTPDAEAIVILSEIEQFLGKISDRLEYRDLEGLKDKLKEEKFLQKNEPLQLVPSAGAARKLKQTEEEESSDDEDFEKKRTALKEEAQVYAEMKKKQQGRGRMMML